MNKMTNYICQLVSILPILVALFFYNELHNLVSTKIFGENGMFISKNSFMILIVVCSVLFYYASIIISEKLIADLVTRISTNTIRKCINIGFSGLSILLVLKNIG